MEAQTSRLYDEPKFTGYETYLPLWPNVFAYGVLLVPKDLKAGERRPVVVTQHGRAGRPQDLILPPSLPSFPQFAIGSRHSLALARD